VSLHVVFGATGGIGRALTEELVSRGERVRAVSRGGTPIEGAEALAADVLDPEAALRAAAGATVVYHCVNPGYTKWPQLLPLVSRSILQAAQGAGAKLVYADNLYAYGPVDGPLTEDLPEAARGRKGRTRAEVAAELLAPGPARVTIGRASDYYGPHGRMSNAGDTLFGRLVEGKRPIWLGDLDLPHTLHYLPDVARGLIVLAERDEADGEVWHLPAAKTITAGHFIEIATEAAGVETEVQTIPRLALTIGSVFSPMLRELRETQYQFRAPFVSDSSKFEAAFGPFRATSHRDAVAATVEWFRAART
jgi:nucleoside-diphosphate-sugar epimerase